MAHLTDGEIAAFLAGQLDPADQTRVVRHLLNGCSLCSTRVHLAVPEVFEEQEAQDPLETAALEAAYDRAIDRALAAIPQHQAKWAREKEKRSQVLSILAQASPPRGGALTYHQARKYHGWPLVEALLQLSFEARYREPREMRWLAFEARLAAESVDPQDYDPGFVLDLQARAWAELANAHRVNDELELAESALTEARRLRRRGTGDLFLRARVADVEASLRTSQRRTGEAGALLEEIHQLYLELGERHLAGRALISRGICLRAGGAPQEAVRSLREGLALLDPERDSQLAFVANQALLDAMVDGGEFRPAAELLLESGLRQAFASDPLNLLRLRWVEGKILAGLGKLTRAQEVFAAVRDEFTERGLEYDAALAGLDLAAVWLQQGLASEVLSLAQSMLDTFRDLRIHREAVKALRFFHLACKERVGTAKLAYGVRSFLVRLQNEPKLRFEPGLVG
jgi:tetratricopeptide (TPR) repeat protein